MFAPFQNGVSAIQTESAPLRLRQPAVAFIAIIHQNWTYLTFKKLIVQRIGINKIHTNKTAGSKYFR